jgi:anti-sigma B factor antagonist
VEHVTRRDGDATIIELGGDVDVGSAQEVRELLADALADGAVIVDLSGARFIDSAGIGLFVSAHRRAEERGSSFVLAAPSEGAQRVLTLSRTDRLLVVHPSVEAARVALGE